MTHVTAWLEVIGTSADAATRAAQALRGARWFSSVLQATDLDRDVERVPSWEEAIASLDRPDQTSGVLYAPAAHILAILDEEPSQRAATVGDTAARRVLSVIDVHPAIPATLGVPDAVTVADAITGFVRFLFLEISAAQLAPDRPCTYFRDQLGWFLAGFLPCGWAGEWPQGRPRVL